MIIFWQGPLHKSPKGLARVALPPASRKWLRFKDTEQLPKTIQSARYADGADVTDNTENHAPLSDGFLHPFTGFVLGGRVAMRIDEIERLTKSVTDCTSSTV